MTFLRCPRCSKKKGVGVWVEKRTGCQECGYRAIVNPHLHAAKLNSHLFDMANNAEKSSKRERALVKGAKEEARREGV